MLLETRAAFYRLPWLAPVPADAATAPKIDDVTQTAGTEKWKLLPLENFLALPTA